MAVSTDKLSNIHGIGEEAPSKSVGVYGVYNKEGNYQEGVFHIHD